MAEKHMVVQDHVNHIFREISSNPRGYKREYLAQELTEMEEQFIICPVCKGIMRDASTYEGEITCNLCSKNRSKANSVRLVGNSISKLRIKCPLLRDCGWTGQLSEAEKHFGICGSALVLCPLECEKVLRRSQTDEHTKSECPVRKVNCEFCANIFLFKELNDHISICPDQPINCDCGTVIPHSRKEVHIETECPLAEVECPYAKYSCRIGNIQRRDLLAHKKEFYIEHQDMLEEETSKLQEAMKTKKDLTEIKFPVNLTGRTKDAKVIESKCGNMRFRSHLLSIDPIQIKINNDSYHRFPKGFKGCRLILDKTVKMKEPYLEVFKLNSSDEMQITIKLEKEVYSKYIQEDGILLIRLFLDLHA